MGTIALLKELAADWIITIEDVSPVTGRATITVRAKIGDDGFRYCAPSLESAVAMAYGGQPGEPLS